MPWKHVFKELNSGTFQSRFVILQTIDSPETIKVGLQIMLCWNWFILTLLVIGIKSLTICVFIGYPNIEKCPVFQTSSSCNLSQEQKLTKSPFTVLQGFCLKKSFEETPFKIMKTNDFGEISTNEANVLAQTASEFCHRQYQKLFTQILQGQTLSSFYYF